MYLLPLVVVSLAAASTGPFTYFSNTDGGKIFRWEEGTTRVAIYEDPDVAAEEWEGLVVGPDPSAAADDLDAHVLYACDRLSGEIIRLSDPDSSPIRTTIGTVADCRDLWITHNGDLLVTAGDEVWRFVDGLPSNPGFVLSIPGGDLFGFGQCRNGDLLIADQGNDVVWRAPFDFGYVPHAAPFGTPYPFITDLDDPIGVACRANDQVWTTSGNSLVFVDSDWTVGSCSPFRQGNPKPFYLAFDHDVEVVLTAGVETAVLADRLLVATTKNNEGALWAVDPDDCRQQTSVKLATLNKKDADVLTPSAEGVDVQPRPLMLTKTIEQVLGPPERTIFNFFTHFNEVEALNGGIADDGSDTCQVQITSHAVSGPGVIDDLIFSTVYDEGGLNVGGVPDNFDPATTFGVPFVGDKGFYRLFHVGAVDGTVCLRPFVDKQGLARYGYYISGWLAEISNPRLLRSPSQPAPGDPTCDPLDPPQVCIDTPYSAVCPCPILAALWSFNPTVVEFEGDPREGGRPGGFSWWTPVNNQISAAGTDAFAKAEFCGLQPSLFDVPELPDPGDPFPVTPPIIEPGGTQPVKFDLELADTVFGCTTGDKVRDARVLLSISIVGEYEFNGDGSARFVNPEDDPRPVDFVGGAGDQFGRPIFDEADGKYNLNWVTDSLPRGKVVELVFNADTDNFATLTRYILTAQ